jgi:hypothetical protein
MAVKGNNYGGGFDSNPNNINRKGRPTISLKKKFSELYAENEPTVWVEEKDVKQKEQEGKRLYGFKLPALDAYIVKLAKLANSNKNDRVSLDAIKFLWEQHDGKAKQTIEQTVIETPSYDFTKLTEDEFEQWKQLLQKITV